MWHYLKIFWVILVHCCLIEDHGSQHDGRRNWGYCVHQDSWFLLPLGQNFIQVTVKPPQPILPFGTVVYASARLLDNLPRTTCVVFLEYTVVRLDFKFSLFRSHLNTPGSDSAAQNIVTGQRGHCWPAKFMNLDSRHFIIPRYNKDGWLSPAPGMLQIQWILWVPQTQYQSCQHNLRNWYKHKEQTLSHRVL